MVVFLLSFMCFVAFAEEERPTSMMESLPGQLALISSPTPAVECSNESAQQFCRDPYEAICSDPTTHRNSQLAKTESLKDPDGKRFTSRRSQDAQSAFRSITEFMRSTLRDSNLKPSDKNDFDVLIQRTKIFTASEALVEIRKEKPLSKEGYNRLLSIENICGFDNTNPLAMSFQTKENGERADDPVVVVCDGLLETLPDNRGLDNRLFMVVAHELSHVFSSKWYPASYANLTQCLEEQEGQRLLEDYLAPARREGVIDESYTPPTVAQLTGLAMREVSCDFWAKEAYKKFISQDETPAQSLQKMRESYGYFCGVESTGSHPSGRFRIELIGRDPAIRQKMGCEETPQSSVKPLNCSI